MKIFASKFLKFGLPITLALLAIAFFLTKNYLSNKPPVLYKFEDKALADPSGVYAIFNPLRDKSPEVAAEKFIQDLQNGNCNNLKISQDYCEKENKYIPTSWNLLDREDKENEVILFYRIYRNGYTNKNLADNSWVTLQKGSENWKVIDYEAWY